MAERRKLYTIRTSYRYQAKHFNDVFSNLGYDYKDNILKNGTSPELWANPLQWPLYGVLESFLYFLIEQAKYVKKWASIAHDVSDSKIN
jgi:hypothetical protein